LKIEKSKLKMLLSFIEQENFVPYYQNRAMQHKKYKICEKIFNIFG